MSKYYQPSNGYSPLSFVYFLLACVVVIPLLATIYSYAIWYIPIPYINIFLTAGFGYGVGMTISLLAVKLGKVRSSKLALLFGFIGALVALYVHWAVWVDLVLNISGSIGGETIGIAVSNIKFVQVLNLILSPSALFGIINEIREIGTWGIKGGVVSGTPLTIIWVIEALIITLIALVVAPGQASEPFCELNNKWFDKKVLPAFSYLDNPSDLVQALESGSQEVFQNLNRVEDSKTDNHSIFTLYANDTRENYLSIINQLAKTNDKGEIKFDSQLVTNYISISEELSSMLEAL